MYHHHHHNCKHIHSLLLLKLIIFSSVMNMLLHDDDDDSWKDIKINKWKRKDTCFNRVHGNTGHCCSLVCRTFEYDILFSLLRDLFSFNVERYDSRHSFLNDYFDFFFFSFAPSTCCTLKVSLFLVSKDTLTDFTNFLPLWTDVMDGWMGWYNNNVGIKESSCWLLGLIYLAIVTLKSQLISIFLLICMGKKKKNLCFTVFFFSQSFSCYQNIRNIFRFVSMWGAIFLNQGIRTGNNSKRLIKRPHTHSYIIRCLFEARELMFFALYCSHLIIEIPFPTTSTRPYVYSQKQNKHASIFCTRVYLIIIVVKI